MTNEALASFKEMQNQLNRVAVKRGYSKINVDGRLGQTTVTLYNKVVGTALSAMSCDALATRALGVGMGSTSYVKSLADSLGAPATVSAPPTSRPSVPDPKGGMPKDPPGLAITDLLFTPIGMVAVAGLAYVGYRYYKGKKSPSPKPALVSNPKKGERVFPARSHYKGKEVVAYSTKTGKPLYGAAAHQALQSRMYGPKR
jgi:hypothetical protein